MLKKLFTLVLACCMLLACLSPALAAEGEREYNKVTKVGDKLYEVWFDSAYDDYRPEALLLQNFIFGSWQPGGCTSIYKDGIMMRNMDWYLKYYGVDVCELVVHTTANESRYATLGVCYNPFITDETYDTVSDFHLMQLAFMLTDGINSEGLMYAQNVCPEMDGISQTVGTNPDGATLPYYMLGRSLLDYCANVDEAIEYLRSHNVFMNNKYNGTCMESHFLIADKERAVVVEFVDNQLVILEQSDLPYEQTFITNHYLFNGGENTGHGMGYERDEIVKAGYASVTDPASGMELLKSLRYTLSYTLPLGDGFWYSEYYTKDDDADYPCTLAKDDPAFLAHIADLQAKYAAGDEHCWHTNHSSVYNSADGSLLLAVREDFDTLYSFTIG